MVADNGQNITDNTEELYRALDYVNALLGKQERYTEQLYQNYVYYYNQANNLKRDKAQLEAQLQSQTSALKSREMELQLQIQKTQDVENANNKLRGLVSDFQSDSVAIGQLLEQLTGLTSNLEGCVINGLSADDVLPLIKKIKELLRAFKSNNR